MQDEMTMSSPDMEMPSKPSSWPTVLGILGIILASLGLLMGLCGLIGGLFMSTLMEMISSSMPEDQRTEMMASVPEGSYMLASGIVSLVLGILLLFGCIRLVKRRSSCRGLLNTWALASIIWLVASSVWEFTVVFPQMQEKMEEARQTMAETEQQDQSTSSTGESSPDVDPYSNATSDQEKMVQQWGNTFGWGCGMVFSLAWIIIILVFMNGGRYRNEIESWGEA